MGGTLITIAKDVKIQVEFNPEAVGFYRLVGYEKRLMAASDFRDDKKDAGEIGAGHTVTALYEIVPSSSGIEARSGTQPLKYQKDGSTTSTEMFTVYLRHKQPEAERATEMSMPVTDKGNAWREASENYRWAVAIAMFGMQLRDSEHKGACDWALIEKTAREALSSDPGGYRAEFIQLLGKARTLCQGQAIPPAAGDEF